MPTPKPSLPDRLPIVPAIMTYAIRSMKDHHYPDLASSRFAPAETANLRRTDIRRPSAFNVPALRFSHYTSGMSADVPP